MLRMLALPGDEVRRVGFFVESVARREPHHHERDSHREQPTAR